MTDTAAPADVLLSECARLQAANRRLRRRNRWLFESRRKWMLRALRKGL